MLCIQKGRTWSWSRSARHGVVRSSWLALFRTWMNSRGWYMSIARSFLRNGTIFVGLFLRRKPRMARTISYMEEFAGLMCVYLLLGLFYKKALLL